MNERVRDRLSDILDAIEQISKLLENKTLDDLNKDRVLRAAYERFLEILSEASRVIPPELKLAAPQIPWTQVANIGNHLRHAYHQVDSEVLWSVYANGELAELRDVVTGFLQAIP